MTPQDSAAALPARVLVVGRSEAAVSEAAARIGGSVVVAPLAALDQGLFDRVLPDCVVFPLMAPGFDALQVVVRLASLGFAGIACVVCPDLPDRAMVERELGALAQGFTVRLYPEV